MDSLQFLTDYRHIAAPLLIVIMAAESTPVIGLLIPGVLILPALGAMTGSGVWSFWTMYACAVTGALLGDILGYLLGRVGASRQPGRFLMRRRLRVVKAAHKLVKERGALAIFLGRFAWLIHPAIPPAAGLLGVRWRTFLLIDPPAVCLWVLLYMGLGHMATGLWIKQTVELVEVASLLLILLAILFMVRRASQGYHRR